MGSYICKPSFSSQRSYVSVSTKSYQFVLKQFSFSDSGDFCSKCRSVFVSKVYRGRATEHNNNGVQQYTVASMGFLNWYDRKVVGATSLKLYFSFG